ncbi:unnamed protein product [Ceutorhynchus assimilis]|uniref:Uncharacterized protein n=1 Tax=Ceutorhynchus assimilis TaxID=467358 RepID=A0A9N9M9L1_9CUCU|nr:unnamed protein product [Ceutorhynchus assimilis]
MHNMNVWYVYGKKNIRNVIKCLKIQFAFCFSSIFLFFFFLI